MGLTFGLGIWAAATRSGGETTDPTPLPDALELAELGQDKLVFDTGAAFGRDLGRVPLSGTATPGAAVQARFAEADGGAGHTQWQDIATAAPNGTWQGVLEGPQSPAWLRAEVRLPANPSVTAATTRVCGLGHVVAFMGQSEIDRLMVAGGGSYTGDVADPEQVQLVAGAPSFDGNGNPGNDVIGYSITRGFPVLPGQPAPKLSHAADMIERSTNAKVMIIDLALAGTGRFQLSDDATDRRRWSDFTDMLDAAGWQEGVRPGVIVDMWTNADNQFATDFVKAYKPFYTGINADGSDYILGTAYDVETFPGSVGRDDVTIKHDHILFDLTANGQGLFDPSETKIALCHHRYDIVDNHLNALVGADTDIVTNMWGQEIIRQVFRDVLDDADFSQVILRGTEPLNYENGFSPTAGIWGDHIHPGQGPDGLELFTRHLTHAALRALNLVPDTVPEFDTVTFDAGGAYADFSWSGGPVTTTRKQRGLPDPDPLPGTHWTDVFGFEFRDRPVDRAEIRPDGSVRVYVPAGAGSGAGGLADWSKDRFFFGRGGGTGVMLDPADPLNGGWLNYPVIDSDAAGVPGLYDDTEQSVGGIALRPLSTSMDNLTAPAAYRAAAVRAREAWFQNTEGMRAAAGGVNATQFHAELEMAFGSTQRDIRLVSVKDSCEVFLSRALKVQSFAWAGGGSANANNLEALVPGVRYRFKFVVDITAKTLRVYVDDTLYIDDALGGKATRFKDADPISVLGANDASTGIAITPEVEFISFRCWVNANTGTANDPAPGIAPYKTLFASQGAAALNADPWRTGPGTID